VGVKKLGSENKSIAAFLKNLRSWERKVKSHVKKIKPFINRVSKKDLKEFIDERRAEIKAKLHPQPHMDEIHKVRKAMKMVIYLAEVDDCVKTKTVSFYRELEEAIGDLHDKQVLLGLLSNHGKQEGDADRKIILTECRTSTDTIKKISRKFYKG
jgi:CHAD domain-containing protein